MCGIVGMIQKEDVVESLLEGLKRLEYRGYDSAGIATLETSNAHSPALLHRRRAEGKLKALEHVCLQNPIKGHIGIGHTRWATHGPAVERNAHPHANHRIAVVHNGIIENYSALKKDLEKRYTFHSQTDTEVIVYLLEECLEKGLSPLQSVQEAVQHLHGAYALGILFLEDPSTLYAVRHGSPLVLGKMEDGGACLGSDAISLALWATSLCYMEDGDVAALSAHDIQIFDKKREVANRAFVPNPITLETIGKGQYRHYMIKEIFEQPAVMGNALQHVLAQDADHLHFPSCAIDFKEIDRISIIGCGTSYLAGMVAKYWFEKHTRIPVEVDIASEFRYRSPVFSHHHACFFISQSGETLDTFAALELCKQHSMTVGIVNVPQSSIARASHHTIFTHAGPEIGVASTKAFTCQLLALLTLVIECARQKGFLSPDKEKELIQGLRTLPSLAYYILQEKEMDKIAGKIMHASHVMFIGRGLNYPVAMEGALKLKEITYIPSQAYASGELKHGPIALVDEHTPIFAIAPYDQWFEKSAGNIQEIAARKGKLFVFTDAKGAGHLLNMMPETLIMGENLFALPDIMEDLMPFLYVLPFQLLSYYTGVRKGTDVDQPRNLAKSVTVE